ncbi:MAG: acyl carrier protein [Bacteroidia bacterium]|nr:acyl carrier protein [Bacteroidia bacterium]
MELNEFVKAFAAEFDETPIEAFTSDTDYKTLEEWNSLTALSIISMIDDNYNKTITGADLRQCITIEELFNYINK